MKIEIDKPVIPQFVADWIEKAPSNLNIKGLLEDINSWDEPEIMEWCRNVDDGLNFKTLVTACLYGYEVEQAPLYYAKIKGWELTTSENVFWNYRSTIFNPLFSRVCVDDKEDKDSVKTKMTKEEWNKLSINETNADFEEVE